MVTVYHSTLGVLTQHDIDFRECKDELFKAGWSLTPVKVETEKEAEPEKQIELTPVKVEIKKVK